MIKEFLPIIIFSAKQNRYDKREKLNEKNMDNGKTF